MSVVGLGLSVLGSALGHVVVTIIGVGLAVSASVIVHGEIQGKRDGELAELRGQVAGLREEVQALRKRA